MSKLTFTQAENVRRISANLVKFDLISEKERVKFAKQLAKVVAENDAVSGNLREIAAKISRNSTDAQRAKTTRYLMHVILAS